MPIKSEGGRHTVEFQLRGIRIHRRCPRGTTRAEAEALETKIRHDIFASRDLGIKPDVSLPAAIQTWLDERVAGSKSELSRRRHALALAPVVIGKTIAQIPAAADEYRRTPGLAPATINRRLAVLKAVAKFCWRKEWIGENLSPRIALDRENNARHVYLTASQVRALAAKAPTPEGRAWIVLAAATGLRRGELFALQPSQVRRGVIYLATSKNTEPRAVPIAKPGLIYVKALPWSRSVDSLDWEFRQARAAAGFNGLRFHDLRHTYASLLINAGVDLYTVARLLGHKTMQTTRRYAHLDLKALKRAVGKLA